MDRFPLRSKSGSCLDKKNDSFQDTILKRFKFVKSLKNYVLSKIRSSKYDLRNDSQPEVSIISYDQRSFADVEKEFDLQHSKTVKIDSGAVDKLKQVLNESLHERSLQYDTYLDLLEKAEKTFARQLDIFEGIVKLITAKNSDRNAVDSINKLFLSGCISDDSVEAFVGLIVKNLINELTASISGAGQRSVEGSTENPGDCCPIKKIGVSGDSQPTSSGTAVSTSGGVST